MDLWYQGDPFFDSRRERIVALTEDDIGFQPIFAWREYVVSGGLMS